jgi:glutaminyl-tRNA synthetase
VGSERAPTPAKAGPQNFIRDIVEEDLQSRRHDRVVTRFPPEPNGYLHIGHAKAICLDFGLAQAFGGVCHLRFDDSNPATEDIEYVEAIERDVRWLGFDWGDKVFYASDYFERLYRFAEHLVETGKAYVCELSEEAFRACRGTVGEPGTPSPYRDRPAAESLALFRRMRAGELPDGAMVLRAKIDMASPNMKMRDPPLYRIRHQAHYRQGDAWCIYPLYDFTHCLSDAIEGITHSVCTLEFTDNRELYDWILEHCLPAEAQARRPRQYEFARLNLSYTMTSKRKLLELVEQGHVSSWDDPRMSTLAGFRRRGVTPEAIRAFCEMIGVAKANSLVDVGKLEFCIREDLNRRAPRVMAVLDPLPLVLEDWPEGEVETIDAPYFPDEIGGGSRAVPFAGALSIERGDFREAPPPKYHRLAPGRRVRLRHACVVECTGYDKSPAGDVVAVRCRRVPDAEDGAGAEKVRGTIHWVSTAHAVAVEVRLYDRLFLTEEPATLGDLNPESLVVRRALGEPSLAAAEPRTHYQLERVGYFFADPVDCRPGHVVLNRTVTLRDSWAKLEARGTARAAAEPVAPAKRPVPPAPGEGARARLEAPTPSRRERALKLDALDLDAEVARVIGASPTLYALLEEAVAAGAAADDAARWLVNELPAALRERDAASLRLDGPALAELCALLADRTISPAQGKEVLAVVLAEGGRPRAVVEARGLRQVAGDAELGPLVDRVLAEHPDPVARYRAGKTGLLGFLVGQVMKASGGRANAERVQALLRARLG